MTPTSPDPTDEAAIRSLLDALRESEGRVQRYRGAWVSARRRARPMPAHVHYGFANEDGAARCVKCRKLFVATGAA